MKTLIIAEAGVNHNGDLDAARQLIDVAADAGADFVKFQTFSADRLVTASAKKAEYQLRLSDPQESQHAMLQKLELSREMHEALIEHAAKRKIGFLSTGFDEESVDLLLELGVDRLKIPSGEITNLPYLRHVGAARKPIILSTGMSTMDEIEAALAALEGAGAARADITVLHCTTEYPAPMKSVNLSAMIAIRHAFGLKVGYSDHTLGIEVSIAAVALGATLIEKHFTLDKNQVGPDHRASLDPIELKAMVTAIRNIEVALGDGIKQPSAAELANRTAARKSLVAARNICAGDTFSAENMIAKRPGNGLSPMRWDELMGRKAPRSFARDELLEL